MGKQNKGVELIGQWQDVMNCQKKKNEGGGVNIYNPKELFEGGAFHSKVQEVCTLNVL